MKVETFECVETASEPIEATEEAVGLIESLGLEGQKELLSPTDRRERCPYREATEEELRVYGQLCPKKTSLNKYADGPVPLRVLQIAAHASSLGIFSEFVVWSATVGDDPVLFAKKGEKTFILARWGAELESWPTLVSVATSIAREKVRQRHIKQIGESKSVLDNLDSMGSAALLSEARWL